MQLIATSLKYHHPAKTRVIAVKYAMKNAAKIWIAIAYMQYGTTGFLRGVSLDTSMEIRAGLRLLRLLIMRQNPAVGAADSNDSYAARYF